MVLTVSMAPSTTFRYGGQSHSAVLTLGSVVATTLEALRVSCENRLKFQVLKLSSRVVAFKMVERHLCHYLYRWLR